MKKLNESILNQTGYKPQSPHKIYRAEKGSNVKKWFWGFFIFLLLFLMLPWTQNISTNGTVTTLYQDQRPQELNSIIPGRIVKWWVKEGDFVNKGDTILELADVKDEYLDTNLVKRTEAQLEAKEQKILFYNEKINAIVNQIQAVENGRNLKLKSLENKLEQFKRKLISDSAEVVAAEIENNIANQQLIRGKQLFAQGVIPLTELEKRTAQHNKTMAVFTEKQQKYLNTKQDLIITKIEMNEVQQEAADKIFKSKSEIALSKSEIATTGGDVAKNQNQLSNYITRGKQRWLIAPQSGQIINAKKSGINEIVKEGEMIVEVVPTKVNHAVELYVDPMDLILLNIGQPVRLIFDGFPAIVFSGWPRNSYGTFVGRVVAIETNRNENGKFRILAVPDLNEKPWPAELKIGAGAKGFALLKNVQIWYELWRQINGFPPDYYKPNYNKEGSDTKKK
ncbi:MAG: HlyD family secretion protein [Bacteroidota bacterium]|jgi:multidrug efflux pump subunit AcrA (membrane-fusion protein)